MAITETTILPPHLIYLGEAMAPVSRKLNAALAEPLLPTPPAESTANVVEAELAAFDRLIFSLSDQMNGPITDVAANESARECDVYHAVGRFEGVLDEIISHYQQARSYSAYVSDEDDEIAYELLAGIYSHAMREILDCGCRICSTHCLTQWQPCFAKGCQPPGLWKFQ